MAAKKTAKKTATTKTAKTYKTLRALLTAQSKGTLPKGVKVGFVHTTDGAPMSIAWEVKGERLFTMLLTLFAESMAKRIGFGIIPST